MPDASPDGVPLGGGVDGANANRGPLDSSTLPDRVSEGNFYLDRETFKEQTVYFDYDSSNVRPGERSKVEAVAAHLRSNPTAHVKLEGHCDERGTSEYNRALGERRALSVREALVAAGVGAERVNTLSLGEDQPAVLGSDESAYAKNRRVEFVLMTPKGAAQ